MDPEQVFSVFEAICEFVDDLNKSFQVASNVSTPIKKYSKGLVKVRENIKKSEFDETDIKIAKTFITPFKTYFVKNKSCLSTNALFRQSVLSDSDFSNKIKFGTSDTMFIDLQYFVKTGGENVIPSIRTHLIKISFLLDLLDEEDEFDKELIDIVTAEKSSGGSGDIMSELMNTFGSLFEDLKLDINADDIQNKNPMELMTSLMANGGMSNIMKKAEEIASNGDFMKKFNKEKLMKIGSEMLKKINEDETEEVKQDITEDTQQNNESD